MKRYEFNLEPLDTDVSPDGTFVLYEDVEPIVTDRDIKAANLKTLVDMVLDHEDAVTRAIESGGVGGDVFEAEKLRREMIALARGLKQ